MLIIEHSDVFVLLCIYELLSPGRIILIAMFSLLLLI